MSRMKYSKTFWNGLIAILFCCILFGGVMTMAIVSRVQYNEITQNMLTTNATITEIKIDHHSSKYGGYDQEMQIVYVVDGHAYNRELATDTSISFEAGYRTHFSVGDVVEIYYNPDDPMEIATRLSDNHAGGMMIFSGVALAFMVAILILCVVTRKNHLITEQEYKKEKTAKKKIKSVYKNTKGYKIRVQYFNFFLFMEFCGFLMVLTMLIMNTILNGVGTKIESPAEVVSLIFVFAALMSPVWILSLLNRRFFGKVVCVIDEERITYQNKIIKWEEIEEITYHAGTPSIPTKQTDNGPYVRVVGNNLDIQIHRAPLMTLGKVRKYNKNVKVGLSRGSILTLTLVPLAVVVLAAILMAV